MEPKELDKLMSPDPFVGPLGTRLVAQDYIYCTKSA